MKILFISSGNARHVDVSPFITAQGKSLINLGHQVDFYPLRGKGLFGYLKNVVPLREVIGKKGYDVLHAHYSLSGIIAAIAGRQAKCQPEQSRGAKKPAPGPKIVVSLLGSDINGKGYRRFVLRRLSFMWDAIIVKSQEMKTKLGLENVDLIPNGVDLDDFIELNRANCRADLHLKQEKKYILFAADPQRQVKNFPLACAAYQELIAGNQDLSTDNCELLTLGATRHELIPKYINACDVLLLTSLWEGSPNIIKEAMACNCPIVSTKVGDVEWLFGDLEGCYLAEADPTDVAQKLHEALLDQTRTAGRDRIFELGLDSHTVAEKLVHLYQRIGHDRET
jgi:glycosyltransferase involved in cell wall biosynthesis